MLTLKALDPHCLLLFLNSSVMLGIYLQQTTTADDISYTGALRVNPFFILKYHPIQVDAIGSGISVLYVMGQQVESYKNMVFFVPGHSF